MNLKVEILRRLDGLLRKSDEVLKSGQADRHGEYIALYSGFRSQALTFLEQCFGRECEYYRSFAATLPINRYTTGHVHRGKAILGAVREDVENDHLRSFRELVNAEIFTDFIEMAEYLVSENYKDAAAVIAGSVLEEHIRQLAGKNGIDVSTTDKKGNRTAKKASTLNAELGRCGIYNKAKEKQITAWQAIRNDAAHGNYDQYTRDDVKSLIEGVVGFLANYPA